MTVTLQKMRFKIALTLLLVAGLAGLSRASDHQVDQPDVHHKTVKIDGLDVFYREAGPKEAPTVLLLHGFPTSSHMFRNLIPALADRYHVIAPDYPGYGNSSMPTVDEFDYTFDNLKIMARAEIFDADDRRELIQQLEDPKYGARVERAVVYRVEAFDWNCPQHITPRWTEQELSPVIGELQARIDELEKHNDQLTRQLGSDRSIRVRLDVVDEATSPVAD